MAQRMTREEVRELAKLAASGSIMRNSRAAQATFRGLAQAAGFEGRAGGWIYHPEIPGRQSGNVAGPYCRSWAKLAEYVALGRPADRVAHGADPLDRIMKAIEAQPEEELERPCVTQGPGHYAHRTATGPHCRTEVPASVTADPECAHVSRHESEGMVPCDSTPEPGSEFCVRHGAEEIEPPADPEEDRSTQAETGDTARAAELGTEPPVYPATGPVDPRIVPGSKVVVRGGPWDMRVCVVAQMHSTHADVRLATDPSARRRWVPLTELTFVEPGSVADVVNLAGSLEHVTGDARDVLQAVVPTPVGRGDTDRAAEPQHVSRIYLSQPTDPESEARLVPDSWLLQLLGMLDTGATLVAYLSGGQVVYRLSGAAGFHLDAAALARCARDAERLGLLEVPSVSSGDIGSPELVLTAAPVHLAGGDYAMLPARCSFYPGPSIRRARLTRTAPYVTCADCRHLMDLDRSADRTLVRWAERGIKVGMVATIGAGPFGTRWEIRELDPVDGTARVVPALTGWEGSAFSNFAQTEIGYVVAVEHLRPI